MDVGATTSLNIEVFNIVSQTTTAKPTGVGILVMVMVMVQMAQMMSTTCTTLNLDLDLDPFHIHVHVHGVLEKRKVCHCNQELQYS